MSIFFLEVLIMKRLFIVAVMFFLCLTAAKGQVNINVNLGGPATYGNYYSDMGTYYKIPPGHLKNKKWKHIRDDELPVVYAIAERARVEPSVVANMRLGGKNWLDISLSYGITPEAYYVAVNRVPGPPYGNAYGYYRNRSRDQWRYIKLSDADVINLVNLRFISEYHGIHPDKVIEMRGRGLGFVKISESVNKQMKGQKGTWKMDDSDHGKKEDKDKGKSMDKNHDKGHGKGQGGNKGGGKGKGKGKNK